jgi:hypothetical protein
VIDTLLKFILYSVDDVEDAVHTSLAHRLKANPTETELMTAIQGSVLPIEYCLRDYIALARSTALSQRLTRYSGTPRVDNQADKQPDKRLAWLDAIMPKPGRWQRACGGAQSLRDYAKEIGQCWVKTYSIR